MEISDRMVITRNFTRSAAPLTTRPVSPFSMSGLACLLIALWLPLTASAETEPTAGIEPAAAEKPSSLPKVDLGRLLKLPDSYAKPVESRRGMGKAEWEARFERVRTDLVEARTDLESAQNELGNAAGDSSRWSVAAPGATPNPENTPLSYKLRQEIRRNRESIEQAEKKLRGLEIEADLAEVPVEWRATQIGDEAKELAVGDAETTIR